MTIVIIILLLVVFVISFGCNLLLAALVHVMQPATIILSGQAAPSVSDPPAEVRSPWAAKHLESSTW